MNLAIFNNGKMTYWEWALVHVRKCRDDMSHDLYLYTACIEKAISILLIKIWIRMDIQTLAQARTQRRQHICISLAFFAFIQQPPCAIVFFSSADRFLHKQIYIYIYIYIYYTYKYEYNELSIQDRPRRTYSRAAPICHLLIIIARARPNSV